MPLLVQSSASPFAPSENVLFNQSSLRSGCSPTRPVSDMSLFESFARDSDSDMSEEDQLDLQFARRVDAIKRAREGRERTTLTDCNGGSLAIESKVLKKELRRAWKAANQGRPPDTHSRRCKRKHRRKAETKKRKRKRRPAQPKEPQPDNDMTVRLGINVPVVLRLQEYEKHAADRGLYPKQPELASEVARQAINRPNARNPSSGGAALDSAGQTGDVVEEAQYAFVGAHHGYVGGAKPADGYFDTHSPRTPKSAIRHARMRSREEKRVEQLGGRLKAGPKVRLGGLDHALSVRDRAHVTPETINEQLQTQRDKMTQIIQDDDRRRAEQPKHPPRLPPLLDRVLAGPEPPMMPFTTLLKHMTNERAYGKKMLRKKGLKFQDQSRKMLQRELDMAEEERLALEEKRRKELEDAARPKLKKQPWEVTHDERNSRHLDAFRKANLKKQQRARKDKAKLSEALAKALEPHKPNVDERNLLLASTRRDLLPEEEVDLARLRILRESKEMQVSRVVVEEFNQMRHKRAQNDRLKERIRRKGTHEDYHPPDDHWTSAPLRTKRELTRRREQLATLSNRAIEQARSLHAKLEQNKTFSAVEQEVVVLGHAVVKAVGDEIDRTFPQTKDKAMHLAARARHYSAEYARSSGMIEFVDRARDWTDDSTARHHYSSLRQYSADLRAIEIRRLPKQKAAEFKKLISGFKHANSRESGWAFVDFRRSSFHLNNANLSKLRGGMHLHGRPGVRRLTRQFRHVGEVVQRRGRRNSRVAPAPTRSWNASPR